MEVGDLLRPLIHELYYDSVNQGRPREGVEVNVFSQNSWTSLWVIKQKKTNVFAFFFVS